MPTLSQVSEFPSIDFGYWILQTIAMMMTAFLIPRLQVKGPIPAFLTVLCLGFVNSHVWSAALFFQIPDSLTSRTLLLLLTNGVIFWVLVKVIPGIEITGFLPALVAPVVFTICSVVIGKYGAGIDWGKVMETGIQILGEIREYFESSGIMTKEVVNK